MTSRPTNNFFLARNNKGFFDEVEKRYEEHSLNLDGYDEEIDYDEEDFYEED